VRVTDRMMFDRSSRGVGRAREATQAAQELLVSGRRVTHPGDDAGVAGTLAGFQLANARAEALSRSADLAANELGAADGALDAVGNALSRARELAVQFANDTYPAEQRAVGAVEVRSLLQTTIGSLNARHGNRWIFGGNRDDAAPFDPAGNYLGDAGVRRIEVAPGVLQETSLRADVAVKGAGGGVDVLRTLQDLAAALEANDVGAVRGALDPLDRSLTQVATARAETGVAVVALEAASAAARLATDDGKARIARIADVELPEAAIRLAQAQSALEASMSSAAQGFKLSLLDYLR
jgi:flagellar hook-associated protein 3 FlgL